MRLHTLVGLVVFARVIPGSLLTRISSEVAFLTLDFCNYLSCKIFNSRKLGHFYSLDGKWPCAGKLTYANEWSYQCLIILLRNLPLVNFALLGARRTGNSFKGRTDEHSVGPFSIRNQNNHIKLRIVWKWENFKRQCISHLILKFLHSVVQVCSYHNDAK